ncbi:dihydrodipicolinate synthase family protein [Sporolactobacillus sp. THM7-7]|nr:dihydrodipicolinate synthase family protein [Sporolactobacillus sp. THM7-7]
MLKKFPGGVWPVMITPFTEKNEVDYEGLAQLVDWYIEQGASGLFAVCQSSEMFFLSREERERAAAFVKRQAKGRVPVIASGHVSDSLDEQLRDIHGMIEQGVDAVILITNRLAKKDATDHTFRKCLEKLLNYIPNETPLGFYECPYPYKRLLSPEILKDCAQSGRFYFLKDTCCDIDLIEKKIEAAQGTPLKIYNANAATLLASLEAGAAGYSGIMCNFHPELYVWLLKNWEQYHELAEEIEDFLSISSLIEKQYYPVNAKYNLILRGLKIGLYTRSQDYRQFTQTNKLEIRQLMTLATIYKKKLRQSIIRLRQEQEP